MGLAQTGSGVRAVRGLSHTAARWLTKPSTSAAACTNPSTDPVCPGPTSLLASRGVMATEQSPLAAAEAVQPVPALAAEYGRIQSYLIQIFNPKSAELVEVRSLLERSFFLICGSKY